MFCSDNLDTYRTSHHILRSTKTIINEDLTKNCEIKIPKAIIAGIVLPQESPDKVAEELQELKSLLETLGYEVCHTAVQKREKPDPRWLLGGGKVEELKELAEELGASAIVFDRMLSAPQVRNLSKATCLEILDRPGVILEIFSEHAQSNEAKTQVEIARLEYLLPRLQGAWTHFQKQRGGGNKQRGMGEKQIEVDRRIARERIVKLSRQLKQIRNEKKLQRKKRKDYFRVAIVGYTNSGKTTIMQKLTNSLIDPENKLFATLDTRIKKLSPDSRPTILLSDTVGFIRNLPHNLVESFKSTLDEVLEADLLLNVVDISSDFQLQIDVTNEVLDEIGAQDIPVVYVFNKCDLLLEPFLPKILKNKYSNSIFMSSYEAKDLNALQQKIINSISEHLVNFEITIPVSDLSIQSLVYKSCKVLDTDYHEDGQVTYSLCGSESAKKKLGSLVQSLHGIN